MSDTAVLTRVEDEADASLMPWVEWAYCGCDDPTGAIPTSNEAVVLDPKQTPSGANVKGSTLRALERPYPQAVAGTPEAFKFNGARKVFTLRYSTRRAGLHRAFKPGSCTEVFVPSLVYAHGYRARVRGARVVSARGSGLLELASRRGAKKVTLTVTATKHGHTGAPKLTGACR